MKKKTVKKAKPQTRTEDRVSEDSFSDGLKNLRDTLLSERIRHIERKVFAEDTQSSGSLIVHEKCVELGHRIVIHEEKGSRSGVWFNYNQVARFEDFYATTENLKETFVPGIFRVQPVNFQELK